MLLLDPPADPTVSPANVGADTRGQEDSYQATRDQDDGPGRNSPFILSELCQHHVDSFVGYNFGFARSFLTSLCDSGGGEICLVAILDICQFICLVIDEAGLGLIHLEALGIRCGPQHSKSSCQN